MATQFRRSASFQTVQVIFFGLLVGQGLIAFILFFFLKNENTAPPEPPFNWIIPGAVLYGIIAAHLIGRYKKRNIPLKGDFQAKIEHYQSSKILQFALAEGGNLVALVLTFLFANSSYLMWFGIGMAAFALLRPSQHQFMEGYEVREMG